MGGVPGPGLVVERVIEVSSAFKDARNTRKRQNNGRFQAYKSSKTPFAYKCLTKYIHEAFFEEYINF
jgi:hypothetical protein